MVTSRKFFIHLLTSEEVSRGVEATAYASFEAAYLEVIASIPEIAADVLRRGLDPMTCTFLICDENDHLLEEVHFRELVRNQTAPLEPCSQDLLLPAYGCAVRQRAKEACDQLRRTRLETQSLLASCRVLESRIAKA